MKNDLLVVQTQNGVTAVCSNGRLRKPPPWEQMHFYKSLCPLPEDPGDQSTSRSCNEKDFLHESSHCIGKTTLTVVKAAIVLKVHNVETVYVNELLKFPRVSMYIC